MVVLISIMVLAMFFQVVTRYVFGAGIPWTEELARFSNVWLIFIGASVLAFTDEHIKVTIADTLLKGKSLAVIQTIRNLVYLAYSIILIKVGINSLGVVASQTSPNMMMPMNYVYMVIPIGAVLTTVYIIVNLVPKRTEENNG